MTYKGDLSRQSDQMDHLDQKEDLDQMKYMRHKKISMPRIYNAKGRLDKDWHVEYSFRDPVTNKMRRFRPKEGINTFKTYEERMEAAQRIKRKYTKRLKNGWNPFDNNEVVYEDNLEYKATVEIYGRLKTGKQKLTILMSEYLEDYKPPVSREKTFQAYQSKFRIFAAWLRKQNKADIHPALFTEDDAKAFMRYLLDNRKAQNATYNKYLTLLKSFFEFCKKKRRMKSNPFQDFKKLKVSRKMPQFYNETMTQVIMEYIGERMPMLLLVMKFEYYTAIRPGELRQLKIKHINFWESSVLIPDETAKNGEEEKVVIPKDFLKELIALGWNKLPREYYLFTKDQMPGEEQVGKNYFARNYRKLVQEIGVPDDYKLYNWKHTGAAVALQDNFSIYDVMQQFRHKNIETTQFYADALKRVEESEYLEGMRPMGAPRRNRNPNLD